MALSSLYCPGSARGELLALWCHQCLEQWWSTKGSAHKILTGKVTMRFLLDTQDMIQKEIQCKVN